MIDWTENRDEKIKTTTLEAYLRPCDFNEVFDGLSDFHSSNALEECYVTIRDYEPEELREDGHAAIEATFAEAQEKRRREGKRPGRAPKTRAVSPDEGHAWVTSFHWQVHAADDAKQIDYAFYDDGWPGRITFSKVDNEFRTTHVTASFHDSDKGLAEQFKQLADEI